jgi:predicted ester cyclase
LDEVKQYFNDLITAFPDRHITIDHITAEVNNVVVFTNITGTPQWQLMLAAGILIYGKHIPVRLQTFIE